MKIRRQRYFTKLRANLRALFVDSDTIDPDTLSKLRFVPGSFTVVDTSSAPRYMGLNMTNPEPL